MYMQYGFFIFDTDQAQINSEKTIRNNVYARKTRKTSITWQTIIFKQMLGELHKWTEKPLLLHIITRIWWERVDSYHCKNSLIVKWG